MLRQVQRRLATRPKLGQLPASGQPDAALGLREFFSPALSPDLGVGVFSFNC